MGLVEEIFQTETLARLAGDAAIGHTRYSTSGETSLTNAQPIVIDCNKGKLALGHNGNLTNAGEWRRRLALRATRCTITSVSLVVWKIEPRCSSLRRHSPALVRLPL